MHKLLYEIHKFRQWKSTQENKSGEWECDYENWDAIYSSFVEFVGDLDFAQWDDDSIGEILYIVARDNETETLAEDISLSEPLLLFLAQKALHYGEKDAKWQLAVRLPICKDRDAAETLLLSFVRDSDEYVNRRALMALALTQSNATQEHCKIAWDRDIYGDLQEYQRIAVLHALFIAQSALLPRYIQLAKEDGRKWLVKNALEIEAEISE